MLFIVYCMKILRHYLKIDNQCISECLIKSNYLLNNIKKKIDNYNYLDMLLMN